jgi:hypothetical protein
MKEIKLTDRDYLEIQSHAVKVYIDNTITHDYARIEAIIQSFLSFMNRKGYTANGGKIHKNEEVGEERNS